MRDDTPSSEAGDAPRRPRVARGGQPGGWGWWDPEPDPGPEPGDGQDEAVGWPAFGAPVTTPAPPQRQSPPAPQSPPQRPVAPPRGGDPGELPHPPLPLAPHRLAVDSATDAGPATGAAPTGAAPTGAVSTGAVSTGVAPTGTGPTGGERPPAAPPRVDGTGQGQRASQGRLRMVDLHNAPALVVLAFVVAGLGYSAAVPAHWLRGVLTMASGLIVGGLLRAVLPARQAGWLAVRGRTFDVLCYLGIGTVLWLVGLWLPVAKG